MSVLVASHALVVADGAVPDRAELNRTWPGWADGVDLVVAADGGARHAAKLGMPIDLWVGDGDSFGPEEIERLRQSGVPVRLVASAKDESDAELAVLAATEAGAERLTIVGALGGDRLDHELANVWLLGHPSLAGRAACLIDGRARIRLADATVAPATLELPGRPGDLVTLLPFAGDATGVSTDGLRYPLVNEPLFVGLSRGLSNIRLTDRAWVRVREGRLLVIETPATL